MDIVDHVVIGQHLLRTYYILGSAERETKSLFQGQDHRRYLFVHLIGLANNLSKVKTEMCSLENLSRLYQESGRGMYRGCASPLGWHNLQVGSS